MSRPNLILAVDQGTTNTKALLIDRSGAVIARASRPLSITFPQPGWVEQDPLDLWASVVEAASACMQRAGDPSLAAIGISNQRESAVVWDRRTGKPAGPCIVWQCRRTSPYCDQLRLRGFEDLIRKQSGLPVDALFSASKIRWLLENIPDGKARANSGDLCAGTVDSWLLWNLTGGAAHGTDASNASRTQLLGLRECAWHRELMRIFEIPEACLPKVYPSSHCFGETASGATFPAGVQIASLIGDSHAALFGHAAFTPSAVKATYGTGSSLMSPLGEPVLSQHGLSTTIAWARSTGIRYALEGNITNTGGAVQWLAEFLSLTEGATDVARLASTVADAGGTYLVPAFAGLGAPLWDTGARALLCGMTRGTSPAHAARATIDSIAYQIYDVFQAMQEDAAMRLPALFADGGASRNDQLMQFQADILDCPVIRSSSTDLSAIGAGWLAGLAVGYWKSLDELESLPRPTTRFEPSMRDSERTRRIGGWREALNRARSGV